MMEYITDRKVLGTKIKSLKTRGKRLDSDLHLCAVSSLYHAQQHGDVTLLTRLANAMPKSSRRKALIHWVTEHGPLSFNEKENAFRFKRGKNANPFNLEAAENMPFWEYTTEKNPAPMTLEKLLTSVQRGVKRYVNEGNELPDDFTDQLNRAAREATLQEAAG